MSCSHSACVSTARLALGHPDGHCIEWGDSLSIPFVNNLKMNEGARILIHASPKITN
jgi:hypothetical protein